MEILEAVVVIVVVVVEDNFEDFWHVGLYVFYCLFGKTKLSRTGRS